MNTKNTDGKTVPVSRSGMLWEISKGYRIWFLMAAVASILSVVFNYLMPQVMRFIVDSVLGNEPFPEFLNEFLNGLGGQTFLRQNLLLCAIAAMSFSIASGAFTYGCRMAIAKASEGMMRALRDKLYAHIQRLPYNWHVQTPTGDTIQRCTSDVDVIRNFVAGQLLEVLRTVFLITLSLVLMFGMNVKLSLIALAFIPIVMVYSGFFYAKIASRFKDADEAEGDLSAMVQENFTGVRVVRAFGRQAYEINRFDKKNDFFASLWIKLGRMLSYYWGVGDFFSGLQVLVIVGVGVLETVSGSITVGEFLLFVVYNSMLVWPVRSLGRILSEMSKTGVSLTRVNEILQAEEEVDNEHAIEPPMNGDVVFDHVSFRYSENIPTLYDVSFTIPAGTTLGILGGTGSGKSTMMYLLDRLYELPEDGSCGKITIGGKNIKDISLAHLRKNVGFVLQEPFLFSKTIKENIGISQEEHDMSHIRRSASVAAVDEAISEFTNGYDTIVGERGVTLSGGQKQRVAIARMLMQQAPIMVFDDSLSAVDSETDAKIRSSLKANTGDSTVILISHRITTLMHADHIIVLDNGRIVQSGSHDELSVQEGIYRQIYEIQGTIESELHQIHISDENNANSENNSDIKEVAADA